MTVRESFELIPALPGSVAEFRLRAERAQQERAALRESELEAQTSPVKDARERIEIWERLHALRLPGASNHLLLAVIARQTQLTLAQVQEEQVRRAAVFRQVARDRAQATRSQAASAAATHAGVADENGADRDAQPAHSLDHPPLAAAKPPL